MNRPFTTIALLAGLSLSNAAQATLVDRGGGLIYDTDLNVTWLKNAKAAFGSTYDSADGSTDGAMTWQNAMDWAANLSYYDSIRDVTYSDWRLPTTIDTGAPGCDYANGGTDCGYNSVGSEMSHLYYSELGNQAYYSPDGTFQPGYGAYNLEPFTNFQHSMMFWSGTEYAPDTNYAWDFGTADGHQVYDGKIYSLYAMAVRPGDVGIAAVPEPETYAMLLAGLMMVGAAVRRRRW